MSALIVVQARMGSKRFPGKTLATLNGRPVLEWVLRRCLAAHSTVTTILATTDQPEDDPLIPIARALGADVFRGSPTDVLGRFSAAIQCHPADVVVRVCADRPLVAPELIDAAVATYLEKKPDLAFNHVAAPGFNWPRGFGAEVLSSDLLRWLDRNTTSKPHREHVTLYLWDHQDRYAITSPSCPADLDPGFPGLALDVDHAEDLDRLRDLCFGLDVTAPANRIMARWRSSTDPIAIEST
jgi:spore coat polysaccharide biosynthesis protein SpsF